MTGKKLVLLAVAAVVLVAIAVKTSRKEQPPELQAMGKTLFPDLPVNDVTSIVVRSAAGTATIARDGDAWVARERFNYPVDFGKVRTALLKMSDLKIGQVVNADEAQRKALKLVPPAPAAPAATNAPAPEAEEGSTLVELHGAKGKLASLLIGAAHMQKPKSDAGPYGGYSFPDGQYVSPGEGKEAYLVAGALGEFYKKPQEWFNSDLFNVDSPSVRSVTITASNQAPLVLRRAEGQSALDVEGRADTEEVDSAKASGIQSALSYFRFNDVADPALPDAETGLNAPTVFEATTDKGEVYTVKLGKAAPGGDRYARVGAALKDTPAPAVTPASTNAADVAAAEQKKADQEKARKELADSVTALNGKLSPWIFLVPSYKAESLAATRDQVVKPKAAPASTNAVPADAAAPAPAPADAAPAAPAAAQ